MNPEEMIHKIVEKEFTESEATDISPAEGGFAHDTFFVDFEEESFVVKINGLSDIEEEKIDWNESFESEPYIMDLVRQETDIPVPEPVARDTSKSTIPEYYHILRKMNGYAPTASSSKTAFRNLNETEKKQILQQVGENIAKLHRIQFENFGELKVENREITIGEAKDWPELFQHMISFWIDKVEGGEFDDLVPEIREAVADNLELLENVKTPVLVHREIDTKNILVEAGELTAILDWEYCVAGHGELDLVTTEGRMIESNFNNDETWKKYRKQLYDGYKSERKLEEGWQERRQIYLLFPLVWEMAFHLDSGANNEETIRRRTRTIL